MKSRLLVFAALLFSSSFSFALECQHAQPIMLNLMTFHVSKPKFNTTLEARTIDQYIKSIDRSKLYLLASDVADIKTKLTGFYDKLGKRNCSFLDDVQKIYLKRVKERGESAEAYIKGLKDVDKTVEFVIDPDKRHYAKTAEEANDFQKKYVQLQLANILITDKKIAEAKDMLVRRYERANKFATEQKSDDRLAAFIDSFARSLDPHTSYLSQKVLEDFQISMSLSLEGIGATLSSQDGYTVIEQLVPGGAAAKSNELKVQDKILAVAQGDSKSFEPIYDMDLSDVVRLIRGKAGTKVNLQVLRQEAGKTHKFNVTLVRQKISLEDDAAQITYVEKERNGKKKKVGILTLPSFYSDNKPGGRSAAADMRKILADVKKNNVDTLVLDFMHDGGGSLDDAVKIAGLFFRTGNVVETGSDKLPDVDPEVNYAGPLVVLIDRFSASASEIVSGALKDYRRAVIVGSDHTFGKGSVQNVSYLPNSLGAMKVTVGLFYIPGGRSTQHAGVSSDVTIPMPYDIDEIGEKSLDYSLPPSSIPSFISKSAYVDEGAGTWYPMNDEMIEKLRKASEVRVAANKDLQKILTDRKEQEAKKEMVRVSDIFKKDTVENKKRDKLKNLSKEEKRKEYINRPEMQEAVQVALDLLNEVQIKIAKTASSSSTKSN